VWAVTPYIDVVRWNRKHLLVVLSLSFISVSYLFLRYLLFLLVDLPFALSLFLSFSLFLRHRKELTPHAG